MPRTVTGQVVYGNAINLNGSSQYAGRTAISSVNNNFTMSCWVNITGYPAAAGRPFSVGNISANGMSLEISPAGHLIAHYHFVVSSDSGVTLSLATWYHIALVRNAGTSQLYSNGATAGSTFANTPNSPDAYSLIGASQGDSGVQYHFNGKIDDVRFYERALSAGEITDLYNQAAAPLTVVSSTNLVAWYKIDESSGTTLSDSSGNSSPPTMTINGSPTFVQGIVEISNVPARTGTSSRSAAGARTAVTI